MTNFNYVILEDEAVAANRLRKMVEELYPGASLVVTLKTIEDAVEWFKTDKQNYDLVFMDIQLADGLSFEVFKEVNITKPVIFVTAYDDYALQAFQANALQYLLKPVKSQELLRSLKRFEQLKSSSPIPDYAELADLLQERKVSYQKRFLIKTGETLKTVDIKEAAYFYLNEKIIFLKDFGNRNFPMDYNLDQLEALLNPSQFFRINRQYIVNIDAIGNMYTLSKSRIKISLTPPAPEETIVSTYRTSDFKDWLQAK